MRDQPLSTTPARNSLVALALAAAATFCAAAPEAAGADAIAGLLADKGLAAPAPSASAPGLVTRVRDQASEMVLGAMNFLGVPYRRGGTSESAGFDCSGFTRHIVEASFGMLLPRRADEQAHAPGLVAVKRDELQPGDLVFFNTLRRTFSHVGIYVGEGKFIHAPRPGGEVRVEDMGFRYWAKRFTGARRVEALPEAAATLALVPAPR